MALTRRELHQGVLGLLGAWAAGRSLAGCDDDDDPFDGPRSTRKILHFDLSMIPAGAPATLHLGGRRYALAAHTDRTRATARRERAGLHGIPDDRLTHHAADVWVREDRVQRLHVTFVHPERGHGLALVAFHVPTGARTRARRARGLGATTSGSSDVCTLRDQVEDDFVTGRSTAKAIVVHHPDLTNLDPDVAAAIETHMDGDRAAAIDELAHSICLQGPAYEHDPAYVDGWCVLVPMRDADGVPKVDDEGTPVFDYQFSDATSEDLQPAVASILQAVRDDASLEGRQYEVRYHGDPVDEEALPDPSGTPFGGDTLAATATSAEGVTFGTLGYHHNVLWYQPSAGERSFRLSLLNLNFVWYGLYLEFLDADGEPLPTKARSGFLSELLADGLDLETDSLKFYDMVSSPPTIFGLPTPFPYQISLSLPDGAASVRMNLIGPGAHGELAYGPAIVPGAVLTGIVNFAVPAYFLSRATGTTETKSLQALLLQPGILLKTLNALAQVYATASGTATNDVGLAGSVESILAALTQDALLNLETAVPELYQWIVAETSAAEAVESTPFVGWILRILAILGTTADLFTTEAQISSNPITISNTVTFTHDVTFVIAHDPDDFEFPLTATHLEVRVTPGSKALEPPTVLAIRDEDRSDDTITVVVRGVPATSAPATVSVVFLTSTGYPIAHSAQVDDRGVPVLDESGQRVPGDVPFLNARPPGGALTVQVPLVENPVPVDAGTRYTPQRRLVWEDGRYAWSYGTTPPAVQPAACGSSGLCALGSVSVWVPGGRIGYAWTAASSGVADCTTGAKGQLSTFRVLGLKDDPNVGAVAPGCGFPASSPVALETSAPSGSAGAHFWLDPVRVSDVDPEIHLRRLVLDGHTPVAVHTGESWGRFRMPIDRVAVNARGDRVRVVGLSTRFHKLAVLEVPGAPYQGDAFANNAKILCGRGESNDGLLLSPVALTVADSGAILVLQGGRHKSVKAFDVDGKPWRFFAGGTSSVLPLPDEGGTVTWLDLSVEPTNLVYLLSYVGAGTDPEDYRLDVYDASTGERVVRNTGVAVGRIAVDKFRGLYALDLEALAGCPRVEPSVSVWAPSSP